MPNPSKRELHLKRAREALDKKRKLNQRQETIDEITDHLNKTTDQELKVIHDTIFNDSNSNKPDSSKVYNTIVNTLKDMSETDLKSTSHLLRTMRYPYGKNKDQIVSPYIQNKAIQYVSNSLYKPGKSLEELNNKNKQLEKDIKKLQQSKDRVTHKVRQLNGSIVQFKRKHRHHISRVRAVAKRPPELKDNDLKTVIRNLIKQNKKEYNTDFIKLTVQVSQIGQMSFNVATESIKTIFNFLTGDTQPWLCVNTVSRWHREVSELNVRNIFQQANKSAHFAFGIMADESGRGEKKILMECFMFWNSEKNMPDVVLLETKDLWHCNSDTVSRALFESCTKYKLDTSRCLTFLSDNTNYMSGHVGGAVTKFNQLAQSNCIRIPCGLHVLHLVLNNFEETAFGKLPTSTGFSKTRHPSNLLYLAWMLHDGYDQSDKDSPLNMRSETIRSLYKARLNYELTKYQHPLRSRWQYELITAEQYLERREIHVEFVSWFLPKLKTLKKVPKSYIQKWELFQDWLNDFELNIEVQCLVKFGQEFYRPFAEFLVGYDPQLKVLQPDNSLQCLPSGRRAHQMPDFIINSTCKLVNIVENLYSFFGSELLQSTEILDCSKIESLIQKLENGVQKELELYQKWLNCWLHLPLSMCRLGRNNAQQFVRSYWHVVLKKPWPKFPTLKELSYARFLETDLKQKNFNDFGFKAALSDESFFQEFSAFVRESNVQLHQYPQLYDFVKNKIWYIIVHQQQIEGLFNKWDLKTHPNMTNNTQQSKMRLSTTGIKEYQLNHKQLKNIRSENRTIYQQNSTTSFFQSDRQNEQVANDLFKELFTHR